MLTFITAQFCIGFVSAVILFAVMPDDIGEADPLEQP